MRYLCTLDIARGVWPHLKSKALNAVAAHLSVNFTHHNAAEDARACAEVALAAADKVAALEVADIPTGWTSGGPQNPCFWRKNRW